MHTFLAEICCNSHEVYKSIVTVVDATWIVPRLVGTHLIKQGKRV